MRSGRYLWNASMFVWRVDVFLAELARQQPDLHAGLIAIAAAWGTAEQDEVLGEVWPTLPKISVDYAVMEGAADGRPGRAPCPATSAGTTSATSTPSARCCRADAAGNVVRRQPTRKPGVLLHDAAGTGGGAAVGPAGGRRSACAT